jgi:predicted PurR-regulated permease PerM
MTTILSVFLAALILAYVLEPISHALRRIGLPRPFSALIAVMVGLTAAVGLLILLINILQREIPLMRDQAPKWIGDAQRWVAPQLERFNVQLDWDKLQSQLIEKVTQHFSTNADTLISRIIDTVLTSTQTFVAAIGALVLIFFVVFYLLIDWAKFFSRAAEFVPPRYRNTVSNLARECDELLSQYLRGQLVVMLILAIYYALALSMIGMAGGVAIGILTGLAIFIPYIGFGVGLVLAVISALLQFGPSWALLGVLAVYGVGQLIESFFLTPKLVGERIGLHPVAVIFALLFFGSLFGFFGVLLALPAAAITLVTLRYMRDHYEHSDWFKGRKNDDKNSN